MWTGRCCTLSSVHIVPEEFESAYLLLRLDLPSTLSNPSRKRNFLKPLFKLEKFKIPAFFLFVWGQLSTPMASQKSCDFPARGFLKHKFKMAGDCSFLNSSFVVWTENVWCAFTVKLLILNSSHVVSKSTKGIRVDFLGKSADSHFQVWQVSHLKAQ